MSEMAIEEQPKPHGTGRFIHKLCQEDVLAENFLIPERGLITVEQWMRSAALYLKTRIEPDLSEIGRTLRPDPKLAQSLIRDIQSRAELGTRKYGEALRAFNGRKPLVDAIQEIYDAWAYLRQNREEQEIKD